MWDKTIEDVLEKTKSNTTGISQKQANKRLLLNGKNQIPKGKKKGIISIFLQQFKSPIILILIIAIIFSIIIKSYADAMFILVVIAINAIIGTTQEWNSKKNAEKLQDLIKMKTKVIRNNELIEIDSEEVVIGDIIDLESGSKIPADLRLIESQNLSIDESILTRRN